VVGVLESMDDGLLWDGRDGTRGLEGEVEIRI